MFWLLLLPVLLTAKINLDAESISGNIEKQNISMTKLHLDSPNWLVLAETAKTYKSCIDFSGNVEITAKNTGYKYYGQAFRYCPKDNTVTSMAAVKIFGSGLIVKAKKIKFNLNNNKVEIVGASAKHG